MVSVVGWSQFQNFMSQTQKILDYLLHRSERREDQKREESTINIKKGNGKSKTRFVGTKAESLTSPLISSSVYIFTHQMSSSESRP